MKSVPWYISAEVLEKNPDHLGLFLGRGEYDKSISKVNYSLMLISNIDKKFEISYPTTTRVFTKKNETWGWPKFVKFSDLIAKEKGLLTDGKITVKVSAKFVEWTGYVFSIKIKLYNALQIRIKVIDTLKLFFVFQLN